MLFDLRGRGRRRTVRIIYTGLALLMGVGLVGFGIGGGFGGGGILNATNNGEGGGGPNRASEVKKYRKIIQQQPNNISAWEKLTQAQLFEAGGEAYLTATGLTSKGREVFASASESWTRYLALNPPHPNLKLAKNALRLYTEEALNQPSKAVEVLQIIVADDPTRGYYYRLLAHYAYQTKNERVGDLAAQKAIGLAPASEQARLKKALEEEKKTKGGTATAPTATTVTATTGTTKTGTTTTGTGSTKTTKK
jgi:hypothetical protein